VTPTIRPATPHDIAAIAAMAHALAEFERDPEQCTFTELRISTLLFGPFPTAHCHFAEVDDQIAAMALWSLRYTVYGGAGIYLEQLFVWPWFRRRGVARALLSALARECLNNGYSRPAWSVLNWNSDAIAPYDQIGGRGQPKRDSTSYVLSGPRLVELAGPR
jgi:GNAT superfamily N-acetyltransferase